MRGMKRFGLVLTLISVSACAPVVYDASYRAPVRSVSVQATYSQPSHHLEAAYRQVHPIEVTLYADNTYLGFYFQPIQLIITNGQYVEIPVKDRRGRSSKIYAHYHQNNLHFDADRKCQGIHDSSRFNYDNRWDKGHRYSNLSAGKDFDLAGLQLQIRKVPTSPQRVSKSVPVQVDDQARQGRHYENMQPAARPVVVNRAENKRRINDVYSAKRPVGQHVAVVADKTLENDSKNSVKQLIIKNKLVSKTHKSVDNSIKRPAIIEKINKDKHSLQVTRGAAMPTGKTRTVNRKPAKSRMESVVLPDSQETVETAGLAKTARDSVLALNDILDEEIGTDSRSNRKAVARDRTSQDKRSR